MMLDAIMIAMPAGSDEALAVEERGQVMIDAEAFIYPDEPARGESKWRVIATEYGVEMTTFHLRRLSEGE